MNGTTNNSQNPKVRFNQPGSYTVTLVAINGGGTDTETKTDYILATEALTVNAMADPSEICIGEQSQLFAEVSGGSGTYTYSWTSDPEGFTSDEQNPVVIPDITTTYYVEVNDGEHVVNAETTVTVNPLPEVTLGQWPEELCHVQEPPVQLTATPEGGTFSGNAVTEDGVFSPEEAPLGWNVITYSYTDENGCENSAVDSIFVDDCVGVAESYSGNESVIVYPNPNSGSFLIKSNNVIKKVILRNMTGELVYMESFSVKEAHIHLILPKGMYMMQVFIMDNNHNSGMAIKKLIVNER